MTTALFALALLVGVVLLFLWLAADAVAAWVDGWQDVDPEQRFGVRGRSIVGGIVGFGIAGMSATFAGWPWAVALIGAAAGAAGVAWVARFLGPQR